MLHLLLDPLTLIKTIGILGVFAVIFAESGLFFGFFLPGDSLLFTAGFLVSQHFSDPYFFNIWVLIIGGALAAIIGDNVGYHFGAYVGPKIFTKEDSVLFKKKYVERSEEFFKKYGAKSVILARFVPVVRTFVPILAGVGNMRYRIFVWNNSIGGILWVACLSLLGYFLGNSIPNIDHYILPIVAAIIVLSFLPMLFHYFHRAAQSSNTAK